MSHDVHLVQRHTNGVGELECLATGPDAFAHIAHTLRQAGARILQERIFSDVHAIQDLRRMRAVAYAEIEDGVLPTWLAAPRGRGGQPLAVQVHAVTGPAPVVIDAHNRVWEAGGLRCVSGVGGDSIADCLARLAARIDLGRTARTWLWLNDIHATYGELNRERNRLFSERGLIRDGRGVHLPASTGIGVTPLDGPMLAEALMPLRSPPVLLAAGGRQDSAFAYGSAFSRAATVETACGRTALVSGTAAIDAAGRTVCPYQGPEQVADTIRNVSAVLRDLGSTPAHIVQGVAYCADLAVVEAWHAANPGWPLAVVLADVCRPDLVFEIECTAWL